MLQSRREVADREVRIKGADQLLGRYVYCVVRARPGEQLGEIGIQGRAAYTVGSGGLCALVHDCPPQTYQSSQSGVVAAWVLAHHRVVEAAWRRWGTVLPLVFNTIVREDACGPGESVLAWLEREREALTRRLGTLAGKAEYGVQVFWDPAVVAREVVEASPELRRLGDEIGSKPRGLAYMHRQRLEALLKRELEARAAEAFKALYARIGACVEEVHVEKAGAKWEERQMIMNLSCLVVQDSISDLEREMDRVNQAEGHAVRLVGPMPPYSFC